MTKNKVTDFLHAKNITMIYIVGTPNDCHYKYL